MAELITFIEQKCTRKAIAVEKMPLLPVVKAFDGTDGHKVMERAKIGGEGKTEILYIGKEPEKIGRGVTELKRDLEYYCPVFFVLDPEKINQEGMYPFDPEVYDGQTDKAEFKIHDSRKYIAVCYETNENYLLGEVQADPREMAGPGLSELYYFLTGRGVDERVQTISMEVREPIDLSECLKCVIFPRKLEAHACFKKLKEEKKVQVKTYEVRRNSSPDGYTEVAIHLLNEFIQEERERQQA